VSFHSRFRGIAQRLRLPRPTIRFRLTLLYGSLFLGSGVALLAITYVLAEHAVPPSAVPVIGVPRGYPAVQKASAAHVLLIRQHQADLHQLLVGSGIALAVMTAVSVALGWLFAGRALRPLRTITEATRHISEESLHERLSLRGPRDELKELGDTVDGLLERLETAFHAQRHFAANASHELRTPLTVSRAVLQVALADSALTLDSLRIACDEVIVAGRRQEEVIDALLTLARSQRGIEDRTLFDLAVTVEEVVDANRLTAAERGLCFEVALTPAPMLGDSQLIARLASNLVENALCYNVPGGIVTVDVTANVNGVQLNVVNTGPIVSPHDLRRLLQPFQRMDTDRTGERLGLGLSIVHAIAVAHSAVLDIRPRAEGGLDVKLLFPHNELDKIVLLGSGSRESHDASEHC
jgi:signal transduction histidine kinase